jgi:ABC-2 type transport system permease protein
MKLKIWKNSFWRKPGGDCVTNKGNLIFRQLKELIRKELLVMLRDRQTILLLFIMPTALIFFLSLAIKGVYTDKITGRQIQLVLENESAAHKALLLEEKIKTNKLIEHIERPPGMDNDQVFESATAQAIIIIPKGFGDGSKPVEIQFDPVLDSGYKAAMRSLITSLTVEVVMDIANLEAVVSNFLVEKTKPNREFPSPLQQSVPAYAIFAMFFIAVPMSVGFLKEKGDGTLQRVFTYPVNAGMIAAGKVIPYYLINLIQFILMMLIGVLVMPKIIGMPFHLGAHPLYLIPVTVIVAAASTGYGVGIAALARTPEQSSTLAATGAILMGVFGGIMVPHVVMPLVMKKLAMISPMYWAHQAYLDIFLRDAAFATILPKIIVLALFAGICFYLAGRRIKWM